MQDILHLFKLDLSPFGAVRGHWSSFQIFSVGPFQLTKEQIHFIYTPFNFVVGNVILKSHQFKHTLNVTTLTICWSNHTSFRPFRLKALFYNIKLYNYTICLNIDMYRTIFLTQILLNMINDIDLTFINNQVRELENAVKWFQICRFV